MDLLTVQFVGSGDAFGSGGRFQACISLRYLQSHLLLDCGVSSLIALRRLKLEPRSVDAIIVSHLHGDHFGGIPFVVLDQQFNRRERPLTIVGPVGTRRRLIDLMETLFPGSSRVERRFELNIVEVPEREHTRVGPVEIRGIEVVHPSGGSAYGYRIRYDDKVIAYSGDTEWTDSLIDISADSDLFICEAYTFERTIKFHMSYAVLRRRHADLGCRRLVLTHPGPDLLAHESAIEDPLAFDGHLIEL